MDHHLADRGVEAERLDVLVLDGDVAILDFAALSSSTQVRVEEIHQAQGEGSAPRDQVFSLTDSEPDASQPAPRSFASTSACLEEV